MPPYCALARLLNRTRNCLSSVNPTTNHVQFASITREFDQYDKLESLIITCTERTLCDCSQSWLHYNDALVLTTMCRQFYMPPNRAVFVKLAWSLNHIAYMSSHA